MNEIFKKYKDKHLNEECVILGTGPTLEKYEFKEGCCHIGVNEIVNYKHKVDYYFIGDPGNKNRGYIKEPNIYNDYKPTITKFIRHPSHIVHWIPRLPIDIPYAEYYKTNNIAFNHPYLPNNCTDFSNDISINMVDGSSIVFEALQFALYSGFSRIYLVGMDCNYNKGTFNTQQTKNSDAESLMLQMWYKFKLFVDKYYKDVDIITINPVSMLYFKEEK